MCFFYNIFINKIKMFELLLTRIFFAKLYFKYVHKGWSIISHAPKYLNLALPDFSVIYIISSFYKNDEIIIKGKLPKANYTSLVIYDSLGKPFSFIHLTSENCDSNGNFCIIIGKDLKRPNTLLYSIIFRIYQPINKNFNYPQIICNNVILPTNKKIEIYKNTIQIQNNIKNVLSKKLNLSIEPKKKFFIPLNAQKIGLFINPDAIYMVGSPSNENKVLSIHGILPPNFNKNICFIGFMACNLKTTETNSSINWNNLSNVYSIYVAYSKEDAIKFGYNSNTDNLLLWNKDNKNPIIVYREVQLKHTNLFDIKTTDWQEAKKVMGIYYPNIIHY